jgi:hypothetical protein
VAERLPEPPPPRSYHDAVNPSGDVARRNIALGLLLFGIAIMFAAGAVIVSLVYLQYD